MKKKVMKLDPKNVIDKKYFHELTMLILDKFDFSITDIFELANDISDKYLQVYNFLNGKYYQEMTPEEKEAYYKALRSLKF
ncbi:MAG: hypothetical protein WC125_10095 [Bacteroidales bacterium]|jgi:hypothetical protein